MLRKIEQTCLVSDLFGRMASHPRLVEVICELLAAELLLYRSTRMLKPARHGSRHHLHQDVSYWPLEPPDLVTVSIAITPSDHENGCIEVLPGSHMWPPRRWGAITRKDAATLAEEAGVDPAQLQAVPLAAGQDARAVAASAG